MKRLADRLHRLKHEYKTEQMKPELPWNQKVPPVAIRPVETQAEINIESVRAAIDEVLEEAPAQHSEVLEREPEDMYVWRYSGSGARNNGRIAIDAPATSTVAIRLTSAHSYGYYTSNAYQVEFNNDDNRWIASPPEQAQIFETREWTKLDWFQDYFESSYEALLDMMQDERMVSARIKSTRPNRYGEEKCIIITALLSGKSEKREREFTFSVRMQHMKRLGRNHKFTPVIGLPVKQGDVENARGNISRGFGQSPSTADEHNKQASVAGV